jgi:hypothetical protein
MSAVLDQHSLFPHILLSQYKQDQKNNTNQNALFKHLTNRAASRHWCDTADPLAPSPPSPYLGLILSNCQHEFMNPTLRDVLMSSLEADAYGVRAQKKRARRRQDFIDGNAKSYARWLNSPDRLEAFSDYNELMTAMAVVRKDNDDKRSQAKERKAKEAEAKEKEKSAANEAFQKKRADLLPLIDDDLVKGSEHIETLKRPRLKEILLYRYSVKNGEANKMKVSEMKAFIWGKMNSDDV